MDEKLVKDAKKRSILFVFILPSLFLLFLLFLNLKSFNQSGILDKLIFTVINFMYNGRVLEPLFFKIATPITFFFGIVFSIFLYLVFKKQHQKSEKSTAIGLITVLSAFCCIPAMTGLIIGLAYFINGAPTNSIGVYLFSFAITLAMWQFMLKKDIDIMAREASP